MKNWHQASRRFHGTHFRMKENPRSPQFSDSSTSYKLEKGYETRDCPFGSRSLCNRSHRFIPPDDRGRSSPPHKLARQRRWGRAARVSGFARKAWHLKFRLHSASPHNPPSKLVPERCGLRTSSVRDPHFWAGESSDDFLKSANSGRCQHSMTGVIVTQSELPNSSRVFRNAGSIRPYDCHHD